MNAVAGEKILLHICCGVCACAAIERLRQEGYGVEGFFYNPNIEPVREYALRLQACRQACAGQSVPLFEGPYDNDRWRAQVAGMEHEPEGGRRCERCYRLRLEETLRQADRMGIAQIASTLSISPHKHTPTIDRIGREVSASRFLARDFKDRDGFRRTMSLAKEQGLYRQRYCGCLFSLR